MIADLPKDRFATEPPFLSVKVDFFGPWMIIAKCTKEADWLAVIFTCMSTRAVHLDLIESIINALRTCKIPSDKGTNFARACRELNIDTSDPSLQNYLQEKGCTWLFNLL